MEVQKDAKMFHLSQEPLSTCCRDLGLGCYAAGMSLWGICRTLQVIISHFYILLFLSFQWLEFPITAFCSLDTLAMLMLAQEGKVQWGAQGGNHRCSSPHRRMVGKAASETTEPASLQAVGISRLSNLQLTVPDTCPVCTMVCCILRGHWNEGGTLRH